MRQLHGLATNIDKLYIGRITFKYTLFSNKRDLIFVSQNDFIPKGFLITLTPSISLEKDARIVSEVKNIETLKENDIVTIEPGGTINIIYESESLHNAIFITGRCNSNCIMCPQPPIKEDDDRFRLNLKYISLINKKTKSIGITGGEPTLIGDKLFEILDAIHNRIPKASVNLLSNGIKFENYEFAKEFSLHLKQDIVVDIPLYSDIDSIHNSIVRTNTFHRTINGMYNLARFNIKIGIRIVVHKMNFDRLPEMAEFIYSNFPFVFHIAFMQMEPIGFAKENIDELWIDPFLYNDQLEQAILKLHYRDLHVSIYNSQLCILPESIRRFAVRSISDWKNIYIDECNDCSRKSCCPGFFESSKNLFSHNIKAIKDLQAKDV